MNIDNAIDTLNKFKKISKKMGNECELVGFSDNAVTIKVVFSREDNYTCKITGFSDTAVE